MLEFHKLTIAGALLAGAVGVASAADMRAPAPPPPPPISFYNWTGFYLGIQGGGGFGELLRTPVTTGTTSRDPTGGGLVGGTVGVNWQTGAWVFGFEADYAWADIKSSHDCFVNGLVCSSTLGSFGTARLRVGGAWDRMLIYGTGGFAFGDQALQVTNPTIPGVSVSGSNFAVGWTAGGGIEVQFIRGWSLKGEALYYDLELDRLSTAGTIIGVIVDPTGIDARHTGVIIRGGLNYRFTWGGPPLVASY